MDEKVQITKCDSCGSPLVQTRKFIAGGKYPNWFKPWEGALQMGVPVVPYACMKCGRVYLYLSDRSKVIREFGALSDEDKKKYNGNLI